MEEHVGKLWHRLITGAAHSEYVDVAVQLDDLAPTLGVFYRALGGDPGRRVEASEPEPHGARRHWLQRLAGVGAKAHYTWCDERALRLPPRIALFGGRELNRRLYYWLTAMSAHDRPSGLDWARHNARLTCRVLSHCPGLRADYERLVEAALARRPQPQTLPAHEAPVEVAIRHLLQTPDADIDIPPIHRPPAPIPLWLHPQPPRPPADFETAGDTPEGANTHRSPRKPGKARRRRRAERVAAPKREGGLLAVRWEAIFGQAEHVNVDRGTDDDDDTARATEIADDLDRLSVARDQQAGASTVRFDLDLPPAAADDQPLGPGIHLPEWDWRRGRMQPEHCCLQPLVALKAAPAPLPERLRREARRLRRQFQALSTSRHWLRAQTDGSEIDLDAYHQHLASRAAGRVDTAPAVYRRLGRASRDLACLALADLSLSTDSWVNNDARIIDLIRDTLLLFGEALVGSGDRFALHGFSSRHRHHVRFHHLKGFDEPFDDRIRGRVLAARPGYYTRMGAAVRYATRLLERQPAERRLLLLISDGKPNDLDRYEGRYGLEDTRYAVLEAKRRGLHTFCVTIDDEAGDYLPHLFGSSGFCVIRRPEQLPTQLPRLYSQLTRAGAEP